MKKVKIAEVKSKMEFPRTPKEAMAPNSADPEDMLLDKGHMDLEHLMKTHEIQTDPNRMKYVGMAHEKKMGAMRSIADLKLAGQALASQKKEELGEPKMDAKANAKEESGEAAIPAQPRHKNRYPKR